MSSLNVNKVSRIFHDLISRKGDYVFGGLTIYFTIQPSILAAISNRSCQAFVDYLPIKHLQTHLVIQKKIAGLQKSISETSNPGWKTNYEGRLQKEETELQKVKLFTSMGESVPQFVLALSILMKKHSLFTWIFALNPVADPWSLITLFQMTTSLLSTLTSVTGIYTDMPVNGEPPVRSASYKFFKILPLMFLLATPRLYSLSSIYSQANLFYKDSETQVFHWENFLFYLLSTLVLVLLYGMSYFIIYYCLKKRDKSLQDQLQSRSMGFFTSIFCPSIVGSYLSSFFILTSSLSAVFHCLMLAIIWIMSVYLPTIFVPPSDHTNETTDQKNEVIEDLQLHCMIFIPILMFSILVSYIMHRIYLNQNKTRAIQAFIKKGHLTSIEILVKKTGVDIFRSKMPSGGGLPPVICAANCTGSRALKLFLSKAQEWNIDFDIRNDFGQDALMRAAYHDKIPNVKLLLDNFEDLKIDLNATSKSGQTALMYASNADDPQVLVPFLETAKACQGKINLNATDDYGRSAFFKACVKTSEDDKIERVEILMNFSKDLQIDLMVRTNDQHPKMKFRNKCGFDFLTPESRSKLRQKKPNLIPSEETFNNADVK